MSIPIPYCADVARENNEPLYGSAGQVATWLLLEYPGSWREKAVTDNDLPPAVQAALAEALVRLPAARLLFIRQDARSGPPFSLFVANSGGDAPALYRYELSDHTALLEMDIVALVADAPPEARHAAPLWTVCTNGRRDRCCAVYGVALYQALAALRPDQVWRSSHVGGHRFAPTVLAFPQGVCYGRVAPAEAGALVAAVEADSLYLHGYRGRTAYPPAGQAAEFFLRVQMEDARRHRFQLRDVTRGAHGAAQVRFTDAERDVVHEVRLVESESDEPVYVSCGKPARRAARFRFLGHSVAALEHDAP